MSKQLGTVKWFNDAQGFGFIKFDETECFVHYKSILKDGFKTLEEGQAVQFIVNDGPKGKFATDVEVVQ